MKFLTTAIVGILLFIAIFTNPNISQHRDAVKSKISAQLQAQLNGPSSSGDEWEQAGMVFGAMLGNSIIDNLVDKMVTSDNYLVCSITRLTYGEESRMIGFGLFGNIFLSKKIDEAFKQNR